MRLRNDLLHGRISVGGHRWHPMSFFARNSVRNNWVCPMFDDRIAHFKSEESIRCRTENS